MRLRVLSVPFSIGAAVAAVWLFSCGSPVNPTEDPENVGLATVFPGNDSLTWEIGQKVEITLQLDLHHLVDSIVVQFGDGADSVLHGSDITETVSLSHTYASKGTKTFVVKAYATSTIREVSKELKILCSAPSMGSTQADADAPAEGESLSLTAGVTAFGDMTCSWLRNGSVVKESTGTTLYFDALTENDAGTYRCACANTCGADTSEPYELSVWVEDLSGPVLVVTSHSDSQTVTDSVVVLSVKATDRSGVAWVTIDGDTATGQGETFSSSVELDRGENIITIAGADATLSKNRGTTTITLIYDPAAVDSIPPVLELVSHVDHQTVTTSPVRVSVTARDSFGIAKVAIGGSKAVLADGKYTAEVALTDGENTITVTATDAGPASLTRTMTFALVLDMAAGDVTAPALTVESHTDGETVSVSPVPVRVSATDATGIAWVTIDGQAAALENGMYVASVELAGGDNTIKVAAQDNSPNANRDSLSFTLTYDPTATDTRKPTIQLQSHTDGDVVSIQSVPVEVTATDANGIASVTIAGEEATPSNGLYGATVSLTEGSNTIEVIVKDNSTNGNTATLTFELTYDPTAADNTPPEITLVSPTNAQTTTTQGSIDIAVSATDQNGIDAVTIDGEAVSVSSGTYTRTVSLSPGLNAIEVVATDDSRSKNRKTLSLSVTYDAPPGPVTLNNPTNVSYFSLDVSWDAAAISDFGAYKVYYSTSSNVSTSSTLAATVTNKVNTNLTIQGLEPATKYYVKVYVLDQYPSEAGSNVVSATTQPVPAPSISAQSPTLTRDSAVVTTASPTVSGVASSPAGIPVSISAKVEGSSVSVSGSTSWQFTPSLDAPRWDKVVVTATDSLGTTSSTTLYLFYKQSLGTPAAPRVDTGWTSATIQWSSMNNCDSYSVYRSTDGNSFSAVATNRTGTSYTDNGLSAGTEYWYAIKGFYDKGSGFDLRDSTARSNATKVRTHYRFQKVYGDASNNEALRVRQTGDGGYIVAGRTGASNAYDVHVVKTDATGTTQWQKTYAVSGSEYAFDVRETGEGFVLVGGTGTGMATEAYFLRIDENGNQIGSTQSWSDSSTARGVVSTSSGYLVVGSERSSATRIDVLVIKASSTGSMLSRRVHALTSNDDWLNAIEPTSDGGFMAAGTANSSEVLLMKFDSSGDTVWTRRHSASTGNDHAMAVAVADNTVLIAGYNQSSSGYGSINKGLVRTFSTSGSALDRFVTTTTNTMLHGAALSNGNCYGVGYDYGQGAGSYDVLLVKLTGGLSESWSKHYGGGSIERGYSVVAAADGGVAIAGSASSFGTGSDNDFYMVKTDDTGETGPNP